MGDTPALPAEDSTVSPNSSIRMPLPTVLCSDHIDNSDEPKPILPSECKLSLPSNLGTPTSPLRLSSPLSLPSSPTPFMKISNSPQFQSPSQLSAPTKSQDQGLNATNSLINSGSATGNPRNKCALQPGHSLMDWIRLGNSGKDLTGVGGRIRPVSPRELAAHNTQKDAWLAIRGRVYNISHYLPYHPGGIEELMRGAGLDATQLFDKVHPWVNYDSLLAKCLVGPLCADRPDAEELFGNSNTSPKSDRLREPSKAQELVRKSMENLANCITPVRKKMSAKSEENVKIGSNPSKIMQSLVQSSDLPMSISRRAGSSPVRSKPSSQEGPPPLRFSWIQTSTKITISIYTGPLANPGGCVRFSEGILLVEIATDEWLRTLKLIPESRLKDPQQFRVFAESGKVEVTAEKFQPGIWRNCGEATASPAVRVSSPRTMECQLLSVSGVTHDTILMSLDAQNGLVVVPLGYHVRVHCQVNGSDCVRAYTPVGEGWASEACDASAALRLAVKRYNSGTLSPHLTSLAVGDVLSVSGPHGDFELMKLKDVKSISFIAAGTGVTPMLGLLKFMLGRSNPKCERLQLVFFNKKEEDILFRENFDKIATEDDRFKATFVLSEPSSSWAGPTGRVTAELLSKELGEDVQKDTHFICLCGPTEFTQTGLCILDQMGVKDSSIHAFMG